MIFGLKILTPVGPDPHVHCIVNICHYAKNKFDEAALRIHSRQFKMEKDALP
jgi:hypothetical protein